MSQTLIRMAQLATYPNRPGKLPVSKPTIWRWVKDGKFPKPFKMHGATVWDVAEVDAFIAQMAGPAPDVGADHHPQVHKGPPGQDLEG